MKRPEESYIEEADPKVRDYIRHLESMLLKSDFGKYKKAKPIITLSTNSEYSTDRQWLDSVKDRVQSYVGDEYHVVVINKDINMEVL